MASLFPLVTQIVIEGITKGAGPVLPHLNGKGVVLGAIAIIMTIQASAFALISLFIHLQNYTSPVYAALIVSCCLLFGAACFALAGWGAIRRYGFITYHRSS